MTVELAAMFFKIDRGIHVAIVDHAAVCARLLAHRQGAELMPQSEHVVLLA